MIQPCPVRRGQAAGQVLSVRIAKNKLSSI